MVEKLVDWGKLLALALVVHYDDGAVVIHDLYIWIESYV